MEVMQAFQAANNTFWEGGIGQTAHEPKLGRKMAWIVDHQGCRLLRICTCVEAAWKLKRPNDVSSADFGATKRTKTSSF